MCESHGLADRAYRVAVVSAEQEHADRPAPVVSVERSWFAPEQIVEAEKPIGMWIAENLIGLRITYFVGDDSRVRESLPSRGSA